MKTVQTSLILGVLVTLSSGFPVIAAESYSDGICSSTTQLLRKACILDSSDDYFVGRAVCKNISNKQDRQSCKETNREQRIELRGECKDITQARDAICADIGQGRYDPPFGPDYADNFVDPLEIGNSVAPNLYYPLIPGSQWVYQGTSINDEGEEETETIVVNVTDKTKLIQGIRCIVINDVVSEGDEHEVVEDTDDWYAQDLDGNVWYCGEIAKNFELFEGDEPEVAELTDTDGSWKSGREGAKAGILIPAHPQVGDVFRQELAWREAEDAIEILSVTGSESTPGAACLNDCLVTKDFSALHPGVDENKYYAPGIGTILEIDLETGDRVELIEYSQP